MKRLAWAAIYIIGVSGILYAAFRHSAYDDPFITYRYAGNLAHGLGLVYNPGERVLSTTTPLFAILLALASKMWADLPHLAILIGAMSVALGGWFLWCLSQAWRMEIVGWAALVLYPAFPLLLSTLGSETPLYLAFCLGAFTAFARRNWPGMALFCALALLTRGDGALLVFVLGCASLGSLRSQFLEQPTKNWGAVIPWRAVLLFLLLTLPWFLFAWAYYGSPLPVTLAAKQSQGSMAISQRFAEGFLSLAGGYLSHWEYRIEATLAAAGLAAAILRYRNWLWFFAWTALYFIAYTALGVSRYFWYYAPLVPGFVSAAGLGIAALVLAGKSVYSRLGQPGGMQTSGAERSMLVVSLACLLPLAITILQNVRDARKYVDPRIHVYRDTGEWISQNTPSSSRVGALEVGIIGYYAKRPMLDFAGLLQPDIAAQLASRPTYEDAAIWAVDHYHPEYLVLQDHLFPRLEEGYVSRHCQARKKFKGNTYGYSSDLIIYACSQP